MALSKISAAVLGAVALAVGVVAVPGPAAAATTPACQVNYTVVTAWPGGFQGDVVITNNGPAISSWQLKYTYAGNQMITNGWNGTWTQSGTFVTVDNAAWNLRAFSAIADRVFLMIYDEHSAVDPAGPIFGRGERP